MKGGIWKLLSVSVLVSGYQMLNCDQGIAAEFGGQQLPLFTYIFVDRVDIIIHGG